MYNLKLSSTGFVLYGMPYRFTKEQEVYTPRAHVRNIPTLADAESIMRVFERDPTNALRRVELLAKSSMALYFSNVAVRKELIYSEAFIVSTPKGSIALLTRDTDGAVGVHNVIVHTPNDWYWLNAALKKFEYNRAVAEAGSRMCEIHAQQDFLLTKCIDGVCINERLNFFAEFDTITVENLESAGFTVWGHTYESARISIHHDDEPS